MPGRVRGGRELDGTPVPPLVPHALHPAVALGKERAVPLVQEGGFFSGEALWRDAPAAGGAVRRAGDPVHGKPGHFGTVFLGQRCFWSDRCEDVGALIDL